MMLTISTNKLAALEAQAQAIGHERREEDWFEVGAIKHLGRRPVRA